MSKVFYTGDRSESSEQIHRVESKKAKCLLSRPRLGRGREECYLWGGSVPGAVLTAKVIFADLFGTDGYPECVAQIWGQRTVLNCREDVWIIAADALSDWCQDLQLVAMPLIVAAIQTLGEATFDRGRN